MDAWREQWDRVGRWFKRFETLTNGRVLDVTDSNFCRDDVYAFFQNCYHLKDWLKSDHAVKSQVSDVETWIKNSTFVPLCHDLCNGSKHLVPTHPRRKADLGNQQVFVNLSAHLGPANSTPPSKSPDTISAQYEIKSGGSVVGDAFAIAKNCVDEWTAYLTGKGLL